VRLLGFVGGRSYRWPVKWRRRGGAAAAGFNVNLWLPVAVYHGN